MSSEHEGEGIPHEKSPISIPYVVAAALLIGVGLTAATLWITYVNWWLFLGFVPLIIGALMLFSPRAGFDRADEPAAI